LNGKGSRDGLSIHFVGGLLIGKTFVVFVGKIHGTDLDAVTATCTLGLIDKARLLPNPGLEIPGLAFKVQKFGVCQKFDVQMPADLDQFGRDNSHTAIIGGKGFIELRHEAADGRRLLDQVHIVSGVSQIKGRLHAGNPATDHHNRTNKVICFV
jgi:hypothetical protein